MIGQLRIDPNSLWFLCVVRMLLLLDNDLKIEILDKGQIKLIIIIIIEKNYVDYRLTVMPLFDIHELAQSSTEQNHAVLSISI